MNNFFNVLKIELLGMFGVNKYLHQKGGKAKLIGFSILFLYLGAVLVSVSTIYSYGAVHALQPMSAAHLVIGIMMAASSVMILLTTIYKATNTLFIYSDYDVVMSLPISTKTIIACRFTVLYILNLAVMLLLMVPAFIVYSSFVSFSAMSLISFIVGLIFLPLIPIVIASLLGMAISVIASRFKIPNMVNALLMTLVLLALMASSFARSFNPNNFNMEQLVDITNMLSNTVYKIYPLTQIFTDGICKGNLLSLGLFVAISAVVFGAFVFVVSRRYKSICTKLTEKRTNGSFKLGTLAGSSAFLALYKKELKRYVGSTIYMFNTAFGAIFLVIASAASIFLDFSKIPQTESVISILLPVLPMAMAIMISTICTTGCSISLEGKNFWIVKTMPITATQLYNSKLAVNLTISLPTVLISSVLLTIGLKQSPLTLALMLITGVVFSLFVAVFGLLVNIKLPNFEWKNDAMAVKQGMSSFVSVMVPMFLTMGLAVLSFALPSPLTVVIIDSAILLISVIMYIVVKKIPLNKIGEN